MSKRRTKIEEIRNLENYLNRYISLEIRKDREKDRRYYERVDSLDKILTGDNGGERNKSQLLLAVNQDDEEFERYVSESSVFGWIEMIESEPLFAAIKQLPTKDKLLLTLRYQYCLPQAEVARAMGVTQGTVSWREAKIKKNLKNFFKNSIQ